MYEKLCTLLKFKCILIFFPNTAKRLLLNEKTRVCSQQKLKEDITDGFSSQRPFDSFCHNLFQRFIFYARKKIIAFLIGSGSRLAIEQFYEADNYIITQITYNVFCM
jgi:hypothetical protein